MSLFGTAMSDTMLAMEDVAGEWVTFTADGVDYPLIAIAGQEMAPENPGGGITRITARTVDWLIAKDKLPIDEPKRGNMITRADGRKYRVGSPNNGACWKWSGPHETYYRIQSISVKP